MAKSKPSFRKPNELPPIEKSVPVSARMEESKVEELKRIASKSGMPLSYIVKCALEDYIKNMEGKY